MSIIATADFWIGLFKIVWVNILLSGDNAVVIALAARSLPERQQKQAVIWGSVAAIVMRVVLTLFAVQLLELPWLKLLGGVLLLWIGIQLLGEDDGDAKIKDSTSVVAAIKTILIADLVMSLDNVLGVAAAADAAPPETRIVLLIIGLALSIPIVIFGSGVMLRLMERFPVIITLGAMLLGWIAGEMLVTEEVLHGWIEVLPQSHYLVPALGAVLVLLVAKLLARMQGSSDEASAA